MNTGQQQQKQNKTKTYIVLTIIIASILRK